MKQIFFKKYYNFLLGTGLYNLGIEESEFGRKFEVFILPVTPPIRVRGTKIISIIKAMKNAAPNGIAAVDPEVHAMVFSTDQTMNKVT